MSAASTSTSAASAVAAATRAARIPRRFKPLQRDPKSGLPVPPLNFTVRNTHPSRLADHYHSTLRDDLLYMTYLHESKPRPPPRLPRLMYDPEDPYTKNRVNPPVGGTQAHKRLPPVSAPDNVVRLERISLHSFVKEAISNRANLLTAVALFRALSGETEQGGGMRGATGVQIVKGKSVESGWIRPGIPAGVKVDLYGDAMYDFLGTLVEFVLPRLREWPGVLMPAPTANMQTPSGVSGVVSFGLPPSAVVFFPQVEVNQDAYPKLPGMHIHFVTNATGQGSQDKVRALLSGYQIPFARR